MANYVHIFIPTHSRSSRALDTSRSTRILTHHAQAGGAHAHVYWCPLKIRRTSLTPVAAITKSNAEADDREAKVLHPGSKGEAGVKKDEGNAKDGWEVWLGISDRVSETHVVFVGEMKVKVGDWDLVRCAPLYFFVPPTFLIFD